MGLRFANFFFSFFFFFLLFRATPVAYGSSLGSELQLQACTQPQPISHRGLLTFGEPRTGSWARPLLTILKVSWPRPLAWHTSKCLAGVVLELLSRQGASVPWEEAGAGVRPPLRSCRTGDRTLGLGYSS